MAHLKLNPLDEIKARLATPEDIARLISALEAVEYRLKYLDAIEEQNPSRGLGKGNASAGGVASVLRKDIMKALEG